MSGEKATGGMIRSVRVSIRFRDWYFFFSNWISNAGSLFTDDATASSVARVIETLVFGRRRRGFDGNDGNIVDCGVVLCCLVKHVDRRCQFQFVW